jgi:hypothetical protein
MSSPAACLLSDLFVIFSYAQDKQGSVLLCRLCVTAGMPDYEADGVLVPPDARQICPIFLLRIVM